MNLDVTAREEATRALAQSEKRLRSTLDGMLSGETDINAFLSHLAVGKDVAASTQNQALSALLVAARSRAPATGHRGTAVPLSRHRSLTGRCRGLAALAAELRFVSRTMGLSDCLELPRTSTVQGRSCTRNLRAEPCCLPRLDTVSAPGIGLTSDWTFLPPSRYIPAHVKRTCGPPAGRPQAAYRHSFGSLAVFCLSGI